MAGLGAVGMRPASAPGFKGRLLRRLTFAVSPVLAAEVEKASRTLAGAMRSRVIVSKGLLVFNLPHYWAIYLHDGRGSIRPSRAKNLVFYANRVRGGALANDPRISGGYPVKKSGRKRMSKSFFYSTVIPNQGIGAWSVTKSVGAAKGKFFFSRPLTGIRVRRAVDFEAVSECDERALAACVQLGARAKQIFGPLVSVMSSRIV